MTKIKQCKCCHEYQDQKYGKFYRVFNLVNNGKDTPKKYRCTVCGKEEGL